MVKIYGSYTPMFVKVVLAAEEIGVPYEVVPVDLTKGEAKSDEHRNRHPFGKVPVLEVDGKYIFEGNAIIRYLGNVANSPLYPQDHFEKAQVDQWIDYFSLQVGRWCTTVWYEKYLFPTHFNGKTDEKSVADAMDALLANMPYLEKHLSQNEYLTGKNFSLADVNGFMLVRGFLTEKFGLNDFPNFLAWYNRIDARPSVKRIAKYEMPKLAK